MTRLRFHTDFLYVNRETKAQYVWFKYQEILKGRILDVGADACHLRRHLPEDADYTGIGLGGTPDVQVNLEEGPIPFPDDTFDCVLCLDVLEHLENIHAVFDELCRVSSRYVIVSLPNALGTVMRAAVSARQPEDFAIKFYGLPLDPPEDRHRWLFSEHQARVFVEHRAAGCAMTVLQMDTEVAEDKRHPVRRALSRLRNRSRRWLCLMDRGTLWAVLEKQYA